mmetsp:Transcript_33285/g.6017  ORF Transcript_33285/g.6017 Transcript_33285/m.6017 type:complete len:91 (-) Transcript_33285:601-873(-)
MAFFPFGFHQPPQPTTFFEMYKAFPATFFGKIEVEKGNMIILPASAAERLIQMQVNTPMLFRITNTQLGMSTHCGVLEFSAEEGTCLLPY